jgi:hypothetical protein
MKTLGIGIFILLVMGLLFFTIQIVKRADFSVVPSAKSKDVSTKTFIDIKANLTFDYPTQWQLQYSGTAAQYAPVFAFANANNEKGYFGVSRKPMKRFKTAAEDAEFYSEDPAFRSFLNEVVLKDLVSGPSAPIEANEIQFEALRQLTLKSGMPGFAVPYTARNLKGTVYFLYSYDNLIMIASTFAGNQPTVSDTNRIDPAYTEFRSAVEGVMNTFVTL